MSPKIGEPCLPVKEVAILWCERHGIVAVNTEPDSRFAQGGVCLYSEAWGQFCARDTTASRIVANDAQIDRILNR